MVPDDPENKIVSEGNPNCQHIAIRTYETRDKDQSFSYFECDCCGRIECAPDFDAFGPTIRLPRGAYVRRANQPYAYQVSKRGTLDRLPENQQIPLGIIQIIKAMNLQQKM